MQPSALLKLFELHILYYLKRQININSTQFEFMKGMSTTNAILLLKETIGSYIDKSIKPVDLWIYLEHLRNQPARIQYKSVYGYYININEGVKQGYILSPFLFNCYINDVNKELPKLTQRM